MRPMRIDRIDSPFLDISTKEYRALDMILGALEKACVKFPPMNSAHEGRSVIHEELDELRDAFSQLERTLNDIGERQSDFWRAVKNDDKDACMKEAAHVGAMALRFLLDVPDSPGTRWKKVAFEMTESDMPDRRRLVNRRNDDKDLDLRTQNNALNVSRPADTPLAKMNRELDAALSTIQALKAANDELRNVANEANTLSSQALENAEYWQRRCKELQRSHASAEPVMTESEQSKPVMINVNIDGQTVARHVLPMVADEIKRANGM